MPRPTGPALPFLVWAVRALVCWMQSNGRKVKPTLAARVIAAYVLVTLGRLVLYASHLAVQRSATAAHAVESLGNRQALVASTHTDVDVAVHQEQLHSVSAVSVKVLTDGSSGVDVMEAVKAATQQLPLQPSHAPHSQYMSDHVLLGASVVACLHVSGLPAWIGWMHYTGLTRSTLKAYSAKHNRSKSHA